MPNLNPAHLYSLIWTHVVNEYIKGQSQVMRWRYQPVSYAGESLAPLADLGLEGVFDESTMRGFAGTVSVKLLDGRSRTQVLA